MLYALGCRESLAHTHQAYVAKTWRQVLGSTMHCVAGDGLGILAGAAIGAVLTLPRWADISLEYALGFSFGWTIFQALFMRGMAGGSSRRSLAVTFIPEFLSMNVLMAAMILSASLARSLLPPAHGPLAPQSWFVMSMGLLVGFVAAYPINWWLVTRGFKHGMMTVRRPGSGKGQTSSESDATSVTARTLAMGAMAHAGHDAPFVEGAGHFSGAHSATSPATAESPAHAPPRSGGSPRWRHCPSRYSPPLSWCCLDSLAAEAAANRHGRPSVRQPPQVCVTFTGAGPQKSTVVRTPTIHSLPSHRVGSSGSGMPPLGLSTYCTSGWICHHGAAWY